MIESALKYARAGWHVFPLQPGGKAPLIKGGGGFEAATTDEAQIRAWWADCPQANIGIALDASGICVVDIDTHGDVNGFDSMHLLDLPPTIAANTAGGGRHLIYSNGGTPPPRKVNVVKALDGKGIDLLANGYIVAVPSVVEGKAYEWLDVGNPVASLPESIRKLAAPAVVAAPPPWQAPVRSSGGSDVVERARLYLSECEPAYEGQGGHNALMWAARCLVTGFKLDRSTALSLLWSDFNPRCCPPWDSGNVSSAKDFERKVDQVARTPSQHREGWLLEETSGASTEILHSLSSFFDGFSKRFAGGEAEAKPASAEVLAEVDHAWENKKELKLPNLNPGGLVGEVFEYLEASNRFSIPLHSLAGALALCGTVMGRKVKTERNGSRTGIYSLALADSSWGKDNVLQRLEEILETVGADHFIGGTTATGDSAMEKRLQGNPNTLYLWDEVGHTLSGFGDGKASDPHAKTAVPFMMKVWSAGRRKLRGKDRAGVENTTVVIDRPCLNLYGTGTPDRVAKNIGYEQLWDGWLPRCLYFIAKSRGKEIDQPLQEAPEHLLGQVKNWVDFTPMVNEGDSILAAEGGSKPVAIPMDADALEYMRAFSRGSRDLLDDKKVSGVHNLYGKAAENAERIALVVACGCADHPSTARIRLSDVQFSCELVKYLIASFIDFIDGNVSASIAEGFKKEITKIVKSAGRKGMSQRDLTRKTQNITGARERNGYLMDLVEAGILIKDVDMSQGGRPSVKYIYNPT